MHPEDRSVRLKLHRSPGWTPKLMQRKKGPGRKYGDDNPMPKSRQRVEAGSYYKSLCMSEHNTSCKAAREMVLEDLTKLAKLEKSMIIPEQTADITILDLL